MAASADTADTYVVFSIKSRGSCSNSQQQSQILSEAEKLAYYYPDSALALLETIDPADLTQDSIKAKYYYVLASAHDRQSDIALPDSMICFSNDYYRGKDLKRSIGSSTLLASYKFHIGERETALRLLDSLSSLNNVPDSLLIEPLRLRIQLWAYDEHLETLIRRLITIDKDENRQSQYKLWLYFAMLFDGRPDSALVAVDELIDKAALKGDTDMHFRYQYEKIAALMDMGMYEECLTLADSLLNATTDDSVKPFLHLWKSLGLLNMQKHTDAAEELATTDLLAKDILKDD